MHAGSQGRSPVSASRHIRRCPTWERAPAVATCSYAARRSRARQGGSPAAGGPVVPGAEVGAHRSGARCLMGALGRAAARRGQTPLGAGRACRRGTAFTACTTCSTLLLPGTSQVQSATGRACSATPAGARTAAAKRESVIALPGHRAGPAASSAFWQALGEAGPLRPCIWMSGCSGAGLHPQLSLAGGSQPFLVLHWETVAVAS